MSQTTRERLKNALWCVGMMMPLACFMAAIICASENMPNWATYNGIMGAINALLWWCR